MERAPLDHDIAAALEVAARFGLAATEASVLKLGHHTTVLLRPAMVVARVQSAEPLNVAMRMAGREIDLLRHLSKVGAPVLAPLPGPLTGPHRVGRAVVTLWPFVENRPAEERDAISAAQALRAVHQGLRSYPGELPPYTDMLDHCAEVLADPARSPALSTADRDLLQFHLQRLRDEVGAGAAEVVPLHGDVHLANLMVTARGAILIDFEDACLGPPELDIAGLPPEAWSVFADADQGLVARCAELRSVCVAVWCSADPERSDEVREAAAHHLGLVRDWAR